MLRISSTSTFLYKRIFPLIWFGGLGTFALFAAFLDATAPNLQFIVLPAGLAVAGFFHMKKQIWPLMDAVHDAGDSLVVSKGADEDRIPLANVVNVSAIPGRPTHVTLRLREPGKFGGEVSFLPDATVGLSHFAKNPVIDELITRIDRARSGAKL